MCCQDTGTIHRKTFWADIYFIVLLDRKIIIKDLQKQYSITNIYIFLFIQPDDMFMLNDFRLGEG